MHAWRHALTAPPQHELRRSITAASDTDVVVKTIHHPAMPDHIMIPPHQNQQQQHYQHWRWQS